ncbi:hypothetical protein GLOIN_2v1482868 [Rhizophagus irregularis DAOM 181602=DAOM 197198]|nr:hypothetical protein GLOIN_2v1482868 [Rhizophagus irregularis DAOM 181602=DAOM 197198]
MESFNQHIVILNDGTYLCTCLLLVSHGIVCHHYFKLIIENSAALFHLMLMPMRWLQDNFWNCIDSIFKEPFIGMSSKNLNQLDYYQPADFIPKHHDNIQKIWVIVKILRDLIDNNDQNNLDDILLAYISKKEAKLNAKAQSELKGRNIFNENINLGNKIKLSDEQVYNINSIKNLIKRQGKGKLAGKRFKAYDERKTKQIVIRIKKKCI